MHGCHNVVTGHLGRAISAIIKNLLQTIFKKFIFCVTVAHKNNATYSIPGSKKTNLVVRSKCCRSLQVNWSL